MWEATKSTCRDGEIIWIVKNPTARGYTPFDTEDEAHAYADKMNSINEERASQIYAAFRSEIVGGEDMDEELLRFEVDGLLASRGMTLAEVEVVDGRWKTSQDKPAGQMPLTWRANAPNAR